VKTTPSSSPLAAIVLFPSRQLRRLYDWTAHWAHTRYATPSLFVLAFAESSFFPVPPDVLLIAMTVVNRWRWWMFASLCMVGSVAGGLFGYFIGVALYDTVGRQIVAFYHLEAFFDVVQSSYGANAFLAVLTAAFTPIPYKVFTIAGGVFQVSVFEFVAGSIIGRGGRFFMVAALLRLFGTHISRAIEKYFDILSLAFMVLLIGGFVVLRMLR